MKKQSEINYSRRGKCMAQTVTQETECRNHAPAVAGRYTQVCGRRTEDGKCLLIRRKQNEQT
ncbi:MAG TPA: hypothetical protein DCY12_06890 [Candidatus Atribacteria bacterium]|nr:hypothetical protein [Candidatus Atribacteria bacterium]